MQISILVSTAMLTEGTKYGIGLHYEDMDYTKMPMVSLISYSAGFATILAAAWSKTSFGITLLRIASGWVRWFIWFIIVSVNVVLGVSAAIMWTRCWPVAKLWNPELEGTCWTPVTMERYQTFTSSKSINICRGWLGGEHSCAEALLTPWRQSTLGSSISSWPSFRGRSFGMW